MDAETRPLGEKGENDFVSWLVIKQERWSRAVFGGIFFLFLNRFKSAPFGALDACIPAGFSLCMHFDLGWSCEMGIFLSLACQA